MLEPRVMRVLVALGAAGGKVLSRDDLIAQCWDGVVVGDNAINQVISRLRRVFADLAGGTVQLETITKVGFRLVHGDAPAGGTPIHRTGLLAGRPMWPAWVAAALAVAILAAAAIFLAMHWRSEGAGPPSIAVMPFVNLTGDAGKDYLGDGMAEELINTLAKAPGLKVPARTSTFAYKGRNADIRRIASDLGVDAVLEGSVRSAGKRIRITAQLIDARDGLHIWSETYDREFTDLFTLQDDLAQAIVQAMRVNLKGAALPSLAQAPPTRDLEAYRLYLQGASLVDRVSEPNLNRAIDFFQQAIARDPKFARAYAGLSMAHGRLAGNLGLKPIENFAASERAWRQALALDPGLVSGSQSAIDGTRGNWLDAEAHSAAALLLGGNDADSHAYRAMHLHRVGHMREALAESRRAMELAPANPYIISSLALGYSENGQDAEALKYADLTIALGFPRDHPRMAHVYSDAALRAGRFAEAAGIAVKTLDVSDPEQVRTAEVIALVHAALADPARRAGALAALPRLYPPPAGAKPGAAGLANISPCLESSYRYALLGALDAAYGLANQCLDRRAPSAVFAGRTLAHLWSPELRPFRRDPRFQAYATRLGYMAYWQRYGRPDDCELTGGRLTCH